MKTVLMLDHSILLMIAKHLHADWLTPIMRRITAFGNFGAIWIVLAAILLLIPRTRRYGAAIALAIVLTTVVGEFVLKPFVARPRPFLQYSDLTALIPPPSSFSFPSGHTGSSFAAATALFAMNRRAGLAAYVLAILIGFSRLYLCVHFPTDVAAGALLGIVCGIVAAFAVKRIGDRIHYAKLR